MHHEDLDLSLVAAVAQDRVIGRDGSLPWHIPSDLTRFRSITTGSGVMVMGRKTLESILAKRKGRPLPNRHHIVLSKKKSLALTDAIIIASSLEEALEMIAARGGRASICGGEEIYNLFLPLARRACVTRVHASVAGDTHFPLLPENEWRHIEALRQGQWHKKDQFETSFRVYERR